MVTCDSATGAEKDTMKTLMIVIGLVAGLWTTGANAQDMWLVGSTTELEAQRDATNAAFCVDNGNCDPYTYRLMGSYPWGLGAVDCKPVTAVELLWADLEFEGQPTYQTTALVTSFAELPEPCRAYWIPLMCGPEPMNWAEVCSWGELLCCVDP